MSEAPVFKTCTKCGISKPATVDFFAKHKLGRLGLDPQCKPCKNGRNVLRYHADIDTHRARGREEALRSYYRNQDAAKAKSRAARKKLRESPENRARFAAEQRAYYEANKAAIKPVVEAWRAAHPDIVRASKRNAKAMRKGAPGTHAAADIRARLIEQGGRCYLCGVVLGDAYHVDHIMPIARGGSNGPENIACACGPCNLSKGTKTLAELPPRDIAA